MGSWEMDARGASWCGTVLVVLALMAGAVVVVAPRAQGQTILADETGEAFTFYFVAYYTFTLTADECVESRLLLDGVVQDREQWPCGGADATAYSFLVAPIATGSYALVHHSYLTNEDIHVRTWFLPALSMTVAVTPTTGYTGDAISVSATFRLESGGPDAYIRRGTFTVTADETISNPLTLELYTPQDMAFWGLTPTSALETSTHTVPVSFGSSGTKSVQVLYEDSEHTLAASATTAIQEPLEAELAALESRIRDLESQLNATRSALTAARSTADSVVSVTYGALVVGIAGLLVGLIALLRSRRRGPPPMVAAPAAPPAVLQPLTAYQGPTPGTPGPSEPTRPPPGPEVPGDDLL